MPNLKREVEIAVNSTLIERVKQLEEAIKPIVLEYREYLQAKDDDGYVAAYIGVDADYLEALNELME